MIGKRWLILAAMGTCLAGSGCISCNHQASMMALSAGPECPTTLADRQRVYLFMVNGLVPPSSCGLDGLQDELCRQGYPKVASGQLYHVGWMEREMRRIHCDDPSARFVVLGYDLGGPAATRLATHALAAGVPVDALVLLDPVGKLDTTGCPVRTLLLNSTAAVAPIPDSQSVLIPDAGHFKLPTHPQTVALIVELLAEVAAQVGEGEVIGPVIEWPYEDAPPLRVIPVPDPDAPPEWNFLIDLPGNHTERLLPVDSPPTIRSSAVPGLAPGLQGKQSARSRPGP